MCSITEILKHSLDSFVKKCHLFGGGGRVKASSLAYYIRPRIPVEHNSAQQLVGGALPPLAAFAALGEEG